MKNVPQNLIEHLNSVKNFTACDLFELRLFSGSVYYFSGADYNVTYDGKTYKPGPLITRQKVKLNDRVTVDSMTITFSTNSTDKVAGKTIMAAAHDGVLDKAKLLLRRCFFKNAVILGVIDLFAGNVEIKKAGGLKLELTVKSKAQGLSQEFPIRRFYPQGTYTNTGGTITSDEEGDAGSLICPYVPRKEVLL